MHDRLFAASQAHRLDDPTRLLWLPPGEVLGALAWYAGDMVADVGVGTGYFSLPLAEAVGPLGRIYALDAQNRMLVLLQKKLDRLLESDIELVHAEAEATHLPSATCDLVFLANVWHEFADRKAVLRESKRILNYLGRIAILDWRPDVEPEYGQPLEHRLNSSIADAELRIAGFKKVSYENIGKYSWLVQAVAGEDACNGLPQ